jgi:uncharacterized membrane protein HdeD (DUF308 family)
MGTPVAAPQDPASDSEVAMTAETVRMAAKLWWVELVVGVLWIVASLVILRYDHSSVKTIGYIIGAMFLFAGCQQLVLAAVAPSLRWLWAIFGVLFLVAGVICLAHPEKTFAGLADILGFLFLTVGVWWMIQAFLERPVSPTWWLGLVAGILMVILAFWTSGQFFLQRAYTLLAFAGIWALLHGITDIVRAFQVRSLNEEFRREGL